MKTTTTTKMIFDDENVVLQQVRRNGCLSMGNLLGCVLKSDGSVIPPPSFNKNWLLFCVSFTLKLNSAFVLSLTSF